MFFEFVNIAGSAGRVTRAPRHPGADDAMIMQVSAHESQTAAGVEPGGWREDGARMPATQDTDLEAPHVGFRPRMLKTRGSRLFMI